MILSSLSKQVSSEIGNSLGKSWYCCIKVTKNYTNIPGEAITSTPLTVKATSKDSFKFAGASATSTPVGRKLFGTEETKSSSSFSVEAGIHSLLCYKHLRFIAERCKYISKKYCLNWFFNSSQHKALYH